MTRLLVKDSIEVRVLAVQEAKHALFAGADGAAEDTAGAPRRWGLFWASASSLCCRHYSLPAQCSLASALTENWPRACRRCPALCCRAGDHGGVSGGA